MGTYCFRVFRFYPYIHIQAEKDSGKSLLMEICAPLCFNGQHLVDVTGSTLFRETDVNSSTLLIDEVEYLDKANRASQKELMTILNNGFSKTGVVPRPNKRDYSQHKFLTYSPKMFAGINKLNDVLRSRTITVSMLRKLPDEEVKEYTDDQETRKLQKGIVDDLYTFSLQNAGQISNNYSQGMYKNKYLLNIANRRKDIWSPLFAIAEFIDHQNSNNAVSQKLKKYLNDESIFHETTDEVENKTKKIITTLYEIISNMAYVKLDKGDKEIKVKYTTEKIYEEISKSSEWKKDFSSVNKLTSFLLRIGITNEPTDINGNSKRCYIINLNDFADKAKRNGIEINIDKIIASEIKGNEI